jgi:ketosteroid isomerase-like protein
MPLNMSVGRRADSEIDQLYKAWGEAFQGKNVDAILDLLTQDYILWPAGTPAISRDFLGPRLAATLSAYDVTPSFEREERLVAGDFAFERGWDIQQIRPSTGEVVTTHRQRVFLVLQRGGDGRWRFARGMSQPGPAA